jgi:beta-glucanase (GH16 family)
VIVKRFTSGALLFLLTITAIAPVNAAGKVTVKAGAICSASGKIATVGSTKLICTKQGIRLVWVLQPSAPVINYFQLTYGTDLHGSIAGTAIQKLVAGSTGTPITAIAQSGYQFVSWSDGKTEASRTDTPTQDTSLVATFKQIIYTISYLSDTGGSLAGVLSQNLIAGAQSSAVTATPHDGFKFEGWSDGKSELTRSDLATSTQSFTARFKEISPPPVIAGHTVGALLWSDTFNSATPTAIDARSWTARNCGSATTNGGSTCMTGEIQYFAPSAVKVDGKGNLVITATHTSNLPPDAGYCSARGCGSFVSGRLDTQGKVSFQYGYIEAKIQMPAGGGNWPAFWMLGNSITSVGWPLSGEIDIVEAGGDKPTLVHGSLNYQGGGNSPQYVSAIKTSPTDISAGFHTYAVLWLENSISFYFDEELYAVQTPATIQGPNWTFNAPFFLILNNAISPPNSYFGGNYSGWDTSVMNIDYVRAWQIDGKGSVTKP